MRRVIQEEHCTADVISGFLRDVNEISVLLGDFFLERRIVVPC